MKLHVKCDRCSTFAEGIQEHPLDRVWLPQGWTHLRFFEEPITINCGMPESGLKAELCPTCTVIVQKAAQAAIDRRT